MYESSAKYGQWVSFLYEWYQCFDKTSNKDLGDSNSWRFFPVSMSKTVIVFLSHSSGKNLQNIRLWTLLFHLNIFLSRYQIQLQAVTNPVILKYFFLFFLSMFIFITKGADSAVMVHLSVLIPQIILNFKTLWSQVQYHDNINYHSKQFLSPRN